MLVEGPGRAKVIDPPGGVKQIIARQHLIGAGIENLQQFQLAGGQTERLAPLLNLVGFSIDQALANLELIRQLLRLPSQLAATATSIKDMMFKLTHIDITKCPCCKTGTMQLVAEIPMYIGKHPQGFIRPPNDRVRSA